MLVRSLAACAVLTFAGCKSEGGADPSEVETPTAPSKGSAGGFSANLSAELGSGSAVGSGSAAAAGSASGSAAALPPPPPPVATGSGSGSAAPPPVVVKPPAPVVATAGSGAGSAAAPPPVKPPPPPLASGSGAGSGSAAAPVPPTPKPVMTPELAAIKLSLKPNWDRDVEEPGSISLVVKNPSAVFKFRYGYEDPKAPADRDAYKKFLAESGTLKVLADRQSGAAWYLEGTDATGHAAFRIVVTYGGKRLVCYGSLYKDSGLGDLRDDVLVDAKKICETIQL